MPEDETQSTVERIAEENRDDVEQSVRDEGRDDAEVIVSRIIGALDERLTPISDRLAAVERAQRDTFANVVQSAAIVSTGADEVDATPQPTPGDYDLSI